MTISNVQDLLLYIRDSLLNLSSPALKLMFIALCAMSALQVQAAPNSITAEQWELARDGERIASLPGLLGIVAHWSASENKLIEIYYPGGEEGEIWVNELKSWLVSLGIASQHMMLIPGSGQADVIRFKVINSGDRLSD